MEIDPAWLDTDFYEVLGIDREAPVADITKAYRRLARELHPDTNAGPGAEERFKSVSVAYRVLSDPRKRAAYDQARRLATSGGARRRPSGGYTIRVDNRDEIDDLGVTLGRRRQSMFDEAFGATPRYRHSGARRVRPRTAQDLRAEVTVPFAAAVTATTTAVSVPGDGTVTVRIPPGVEDGASIRVPVSGGAGRAGALVVTVRVEPHRFFGRTGDHLTLTVPISYSEAVLGADVSVPTFDGEPVRLRIPPGTPTGRVFRVRGRGFRSDTGRGDLLVTVQVDVPSELTDRQRELIDQLADQDDPDLRDHLEAR